MNTTTSLKNEMIEAESCVENLDSELHGLQTATEPDSDAIKAKKVELREAKKVMKKAVQAAAKEEEKAAKAEERELKKKEKVEAKAKAKEEKAAEREANRMPEQNGIRKPKPTTLCGRVWELADTLSSGFGQPTPIKDLLVAAREQNLNEGNVKAEYARWRKFHGISGKIGKKESSETN